MDLNINVELVIRALGERDLALLQLQSQRDTLQAELTKLQENVKHLQDKYEKPAPKAAPRVDKT